MRRWFKMLFLSVAIAATLLLALPASSQLNPSRCTFNGRALYGKVRVVQAFPDIKVQVVSSGEDLDVKFVENFADKCGEWQIVDIFPDLKIQFVPLFPDLKIRFVSSSPGIPR